MWLDEAGRGWLPVAVGCHLGSQLGYLRDPRTCRNAPVGGCRTRVDMQAVEARSPWRYGRRTFLLRWSRTCRALAFCGLAWIRARQPAVSSAPEPTGPAPRVSASRSASPPRSGSPTSLISCRNGRSRNSPPQGAPRPGRSARSTPVPTRWPLRPAAARPYGAARHPARSSASSER